MIRKHFEQSPPHPPRRDGFGAPTVLTVSGRTHVLVAGRSEVTRVVVCRILERAGLRPVSAAPDDAAPLLACLELEAVVLDGGADNRDCNGLLAGIEARRRVSLDGGPRVVLLSNRNGTPLALGLPAVVDAVVSKPITPERLRPMVEKLVGRARR